MLSNETTASSDIDIDDDDDANEALLTVIGFLEACVPRMVELIEAAAQGALSPETFEECFVVNDKLTNALADADKDPKDRRPLTTAAVGGGGASSDSSSGTAIMQNNADGIGEGMKQLQLLSVAGGGKTTGLLDSEETKMPESEDPFAGGLDLLAPTPPAAVFKISESLGSSESASEADGVAAAAAAAAGGGAAKAENDDDFDAFFRDRTAAP
jgi:hypothetical protein